MERVLFTETEALKLYNSLMAISKKYPKSLLLEKSDLPLAINNRSNVIFMIDSAGLGMMPCIMFNSRVSSNDDLSIDYRESAFIDFFNRTSYIEKLSPNSEELLWIMSWVEIIFWYLKMGIIKNNFNIKATRDPLNYLWLAGANYTRKHKLLIILAGLTQNEAETFIQIPENYWKDILDAPKIEDILYNFKPVYID